jgi:orotidine-5'-phosphate decarboxylase
MTHFADRLGAAVRSKGTPLCVGLDPRWESLPTELRGRYREQTLDAQAGAYGEFCCRVIDLVAPLAAIVKPQAAFFEACGPAGFAALQQVIQHARQHGLLTILDGKRNDIASTAAAYAEAAFQVWGADALTINPYLGRDAVEPFLQCARKSGGGVFVLVRTSNPGAGQFQDLVCGGRPLYLHVAEAVRAWTRENLGGSGYGDVGAVVGATHPDELARVRQLVPEAILLLPGYGAQGATASDCAAAFRDDGSGAIINSSRGITFPFDPQDSDWEARIESAARRTIADLAVITPRR